MPRTDLVVLEEHGFEKFAGVLGRGEEWDSGFVRGMKRVQTKLVGESGEDRNCDTRLDM